MDCYNRSAILDLEITPHMLEVGGEVTALCGHSAEYTWLPVVAAKLNGS